MPYNYIDFIRDEARRRQAANARPSAVRGSYRGIDISRRPTQGNQPYGTFRGEALGRFDSGSTGNTGNVILGRQGYGQNEGMLREDAANFQRPRSLAGSGLTPAERHALGADFARPNAYAGPVNSAPARQAINAAIEGNAALGNAGEKTVISNDGYQTTYHDDGSPPSRIKLSGGTRVSRTEDGHTILSFPSGKNRIVSATGQVYNYQPPQDKGGVGGLAPEEASNYLNASRLPFNLKAGRGAFSPASTVPLVGEEPRAVPSSSNNPLDNYGFRPDATGASAPLPSSTNPLNNYGVGNPISNPAPREGGGYPSSIDNFTVPHPIAKTLEDFSNPVISPDKVSSYLQANATVSPFSSRTAAPTPTPTPTGNILTPPTIPYEGPFSSIKSPVNAPLPTPAGTPAAVPSVDEEERRRRGLQ